MRSRNRSRPWVRKAPNKRPRYGRRGKPLQRAAALLRGLVTTVVLVGAGALIGFFLEEWQVVRLAGTAPSETPPDALSEASPPLLNLANRIKVEVLNGAGEAGLARTFADRLRDRGFDVVATTNADHFEHQVTHVLDRSGRLGIATQVATGLGTDSVAVALDPDLFLDASVVVGHDWRDLPGSN